VGHFSLATIIDSEHPAVAFSERPKLNIFLHKSKTSGDELYLQNLLQADKSMPNQLEMLIALYKFYLSRGDTEKAEEIVFQTLVKASLLGGFSHIWNKLTSKCADWNNPSGPSRVFLYSLKVLAIIRLRQKDFKDAKEIFSVICRLDPDNQIKSKNFNNRLSAISGK